jgi:hypothetical protein
MRTWLIFGEMAALGALPGRTTSSDKRNGETHQRDATDQQAAAPMLQHVSVSRKNICDRGSQATDRKTGPTHD